MAGGERGEGEGRASRSIRKKDSEKRRGRNVGGAGAPRLVGATAPVHCAARGDQWEASYRAVATAHPAYGDVAVEHGRLRARTLKRCAEIFVKSA